MRAMKLAGLVLAVLLVAPQGPAAADIHAYTDPREDIAAGDISKVRINNAPRNLFVRVKFFDGHYDLTRIYIDTRRRNPGPEFVATVDMSYGKRYLSIDLDRVRTGWRGQRNRKCGSLGVWISRAGNVNATVPRRCLKINGAKPRAARVAASEAAEGGGIHEWAPGRKRFPRRWVQHN